MTRTEVRASASLASVFALRMLGLFLILPVFSVLMIVVNLLLRSVL